jgi:aldehyde dehydrogenase (NAD+)
MASDPDYGMFVNGETVPSASGEVFQLTDPSTGEPFTTVAKGGPDDIDRAVRTAREAFESGVWSEKSPKERAAIMRAIAAKFLERAEQFALAEVQSSGTTLRRFLNVDVVLVMDLFLRMADMLEEFPHKEVLDAIPIPGPSHDFVIREPIGVCGMITPWNFPLILASWKVAPALAMGNTMVIKPASYTPLSTLLLAEVCTEAGVPPGVINVVPGPGGVTGESLVTHPEVDKVAFTGSTVIGRRIMQLAAGTIKKVTLELGGKSPNIILDDANLDVAVPGSLFAFLMHNGQVCESGTRLLVPRGLHDEILDRMCAIAKNLKVGSPLDPTSDMGPIVSKSQLETILSYVDAGKQEGARLVIGGNRLHPEGYEGGYYMEPTIFTDVKNDMRIAQEEIFGPVLAVIPYEGLDDALRIANDTIYGLAGGVWTQDPEKALYVARKIKAGTVWVNDWHILRNDGPFGGYKQSGIGRELGHFGLEEYSEVKRIHTSMVPEREKRALYDRVLTLR